MQACKMLSSEFRIGRGSPLSLRKRYSVVYKQIRQQLLYFHEKSKAESSSLIWLMESSTYRLTMKSAFCHNKP